MKTILEPEVASNKTLKAVVDAATPVLADAIGERASEVTATWSVRLDDNARALLHLSLADDRGEAAKDFALEALQSRDKSEWRFRRLWDDVLSGALRRKIKALEEYAAAEDS